MAFMNTPRVIDRIRDIAAREPERPALRAGGRSIGFGELVEAATRVGDLLRSRGVGPEDVVATVLPRGGDSIIALLGIWLSGAAYLPTDVRWPARRLDLVLAESATCVLRPGAEGEAVAGMPGGPGLRLTGLAPDHAPAPAAATERNLAYVLYTSGSTGTPNAVGVEFGAIDNYGGYLRELVERTPAYAGDLSVLLSANLCFDASLRPVLLLAAGATLVVAPELADGSWQEVIDCIADHKVTVLSGVPSWYSGLLGAGFRPGGAGVRLAFLGGEAVPNGLVRELVTNGCAVVVQYGPTETAVAATGGMLTRDDFTEAPIGEAIPGARVHLFRDGEPGSVPEGEPGHVYVGGAGVARGYLRNPRLTAERFVPDPAGPPGSRMFRTGDLARMLPGDGYSFLGRTDDQVKIGGLRIELGEIRSVLDRHDAVAQSVVFVHRDGAHPRLVACYVGHGDPDRPGAEQSLREHLAGELPDYLVPAVIRQVESFPVTGHGKVDVAALGQLLAAGDAPALADGPALDEVERRLIAVVSKTLGVPCTLDDDFFELGGGSLDALDVLARVREDFGVRVRLRDFFQSRTIRSLRGLIGEAS